MSGSERKRWHVLADLANQNGLKRIAEIGVKTGRLTWELLQRVPNSHVTAIDSWAPYEDHPEWSAQNHEKHEKRFDIRLSSHNGRVTKMKMTSAEASEQIEDASLDLVFIDADHSYEAVKRDIELWLPKVKPGGILAGHDFDNTEKYGDRFKGVDRAVKERFGEFQTDADSVWWITA